MPKMKSKSGAKKRFRKTGTGKIRRNKMNRRHILTKKSTKRKRHLRKAGYIADCMEKQVTRMIPYA